MHVSRIIDNRTFPAIHSLKLSIYGLVLKRSSTARRFPPNQIHLSLSLPPTLTSQSGPSLDPYASKVLLLLEKRLGAWLEELLAQEKIAQ